MDNSAAFQCCTPRRAGRRRGRRRRDARARTRLIHYKKLRHSHHFYTPRARGAPGIEV
jgi:hypothetical protein